jgi:hypothetical protein
MTEEMNSEQPSQIVARAYSNEFLRELGARFQFDTISPERTRRLRRIGELYLATSRMQKSNREMAPEHRKELLKLKSRLSGLQTQLELLRSDIPMMFSLGDLIICAESDSGNSGMENNAPRAEPARQADLPGLGVRPVLSLDDLVVPREEGRQSDISAEDIPCAKIPGPYRELSRHLEILNAGLETMVAQSAPSSGRPINQGLEVFVRHAANFWTQELAREFTLDYEDGTGTTQAFLFVQFLISPLADISDKQIVTAMRREVGVRRRVAAGERP